MENRSASRLIEKARSASSAEELSALARESGYPLDDERAKALFERLHNEGELSDDELDSVSGGGCGMSCCPCCGYPLDTDNRVCRGCGARY